MVRQTPTTMVECYKLSKVYHPQVTALREASLSAGRGEIIFITGASGAGKTTLLKLICHQEKPDRGLVTVNGHDLARMNPEQLQRMRRDIGVAYQDFRLLPQLSVARNIAMAMEVDYQPVATIHQRTAELLAQLELTDKAQRPVATLSRGEQQRVTIARAAAGHPSLLLADEPTGNLDDRSGELIMALFRELAAAGTTVITATHDARLHRRHDHRVFHLARGVLQPAPPERRARRSAPHHQEGR